MIKQLYYTNCVSLFYESYFCEQPFPIIENVDILFQ